MGVVTFVISTHMKEDSGSLRVWINYGSFAYTVLHTFAGNGRIAVASLYKYYTIVVIMSVSARLFLQATTSWF